MKLQDQVITLEQAKRFKELGVTSETFMVWMEAEELDGEGNHKEWVPALFVEIQSNGMDMTCVSELPDGCTNDDNECHNTRGSYPAYTVAELGVMIPNCYSTMKLHEGWRVYNEEDQDGTGKDEIFDTEAQARGAALIYLLETNIMTAEQCNAPLI